MRVAAMMFTLLVVLSGCGGGAGDSPPTRILTTTKAVATFTTSLAPPLTASIGSVEFTADLPAGVTVPTDPNGVIPSANLALVDRALAVSTQLALGTYTPPGNGIPGRIHIAVITLNAAGNGSGMQPGMFAEIRYDVAPDVSMSASLFPQPANVVITDSAGAVIPASEAQVTSVTTLQ